MLAATAIAQSQVTLPVELDRTWGQGSTSLLGGNSTRTQLVYADPFPVGTAVLGVGFRPTASTADRASFTADIEVRVSSGPNAPGALDGTFANNVGNDEVVVFPQQTVTIPAMPANRSTGFFAEIPFTTPFVFGLNGNTNLVVEVVVFSRSAGASWSTDRIFANANGRATTAGIGCGSATIGTSSTGSYTPGSTVNVTISGAPSNGVALLVPSFDQKEFVPGLPLPFGLSSVGAGAGCDLLVAPEVGGLTYLLDAAGGATASVPIPASFASASLGFQWAYLVPPTAQNPLGLETTASRAVFIGPIVAVPSAQYVWNLSSATSATGNNTTDSCPVIKLTIQ
ncbi:MAG: hypothetical protein KAI24_02470 [Planctomycetes bacterium]|nr:hypothetical protein [Planctomycetota bacterium]